MDPTIVTPTRQDFGGVRYYLCGRYYQHKGQRLHRAVWEHHHGPIPEGMHVHHRNHDRADNRLVNLELKSAGEHAAHHNRELTPARQAALQAVAPALRAGNARLTPEQRAAAAATGWGGVARHTVTCSVCSVEFTTPFPTRARYCGGTCRARARRARLRS